MRQALQIAGRPRHERRAAPRRTIASGSTLRTDDRQPIDVVVRDLSSEGCSIDTSHPLAIGSKVSIGLVGIGSAVARIVRRTESGYGCELVTPLTGNAAYAAFRRDPVVTGAFPSFLIPDGEGGRPVSASLALRIWTILGAAAIAWGGLLAALLWLAER